MQRRGPAWTAVLCAGAAALCGCASGSKARAIFAQAERTVITVRAVIKVTANGRDNENKVDIVGTVIDPSGLTVVPASALDPASAMRAVLRNRSGPEFKVESSVSETTLVLADGSELEADVLLKDEELDLAFLRPRQLDKPLAAAALAPPRSQPQLLDEVVVVGRYGRSVNRTPWLEVARVRALVKGPRPYLICSDASSEALGSIAYSTDGATLGLFVTHIGKDTDRAGRPVTVVLRAVEDVIEVAEQAKKLKNPERKGEAAASPASPAPVPAAAPSSPAATTPAKP